MIKASHSPVFDSVFGVYLNAHMRLAFKSIEINNYFDDKGGPILLIGNHFSWWDGFIARHINKRILKRKLHLMMDEEQLSKRRFLSKLGAFSIKKNSRSARLSLQYATELLSNPENLLILFPQGKFQSMHQHPLSFESGWFRIIKNAPKNMQVLFMASLVEYFAASRPHLNIYLDRPDCISEEEIPSIDSARGKPSHQALFSDASDVEASYNAFMARCIASQNSKC